MAAIKIMYLNIHAWIVMVGYFLTVFVLTIHSHAAVLEGFLITLPLFFLILFWSIKASPLFTKSYLSQEELFSMDLYLISMSFFSANLFGLAIQYNNSDILGWWPLIMYYMFIMGFIFALLFSLGAMKKNNHKKYTGWFSKFLFIILFILCSVPNFYPKSIFSSADLFYFLLCLLLVGNWIWGRTGIFVKKMRNHK